MAQKNIGHYVLAGATSSAHLLMLMPEPLGETFIRSHMEPHFSTSLYSKSHKDVKFMY